VGSSSSRTRGSPQRNGGEDDTGLLATRQLVDQSEVILFGQAKLAEHGAGLPQLALKVRVLL
jgi:hypothetical protein